MNQCQCGCGTAIPGLSKLGIPQRFVHGHNARLQQKEPCSVVTCHRTAHSFGYCGKHYARIKLHGTIHPVTAKHQPELHFWSFVAAPGLVDGCWIWTGERDAAGYGMTHVGSRLTGTRTKSAHRVAYLLRIGEIPEGLHLDHLCREPACVNPEHLEPVTPAENTRRGLHGVLRTHCRRGHELTPENTYIRSRYNSRKCRRCSADDARKKRAAVRAEISLTGHGGEA